MESLARQSVTPRSAAVPSGRLPRVLFVSCHRPWPAISGGRRREWELLRRLAARWHIHLVVVSKTGESDDAECSMLTQTSASGDLIAADPPALRGSRPRS